MTEANASTTREAVRRADALLWEKLSPEQRAEYERTKSFLVVTPAGRRYRLHADRVNYQVDLLAPDSEYVLAKYCVQPRDAEIPKADALLAQMLLLLSDEALFLLTANVDPKVSSLHRYLSGEIRPREPEQPPSAPTGYRIGGSPPLARRDAMVLEIHETYRCAHHGAPVTRVRRSADGRGFVVSYDCDCPSQYVSERAHGQRERLRQELHRPWVHPTRFVSSHPLSTMHCSPNMSTNSASPPASPSRTPCATSPSPRGASSTP